MPPSHWKCRRTENDLHPKALKGLLEFIIEKSTDNQFIISTHSNIVTKYLGASPAAKVFKVEMRQDAGRLPTSTCTLVPHEPAARLALLEELGYEPSDFYLWKAFLILEESTAERLIRDFFIPYMVPQLQGKLKTLASQGVDEVALRMADLLRLFVFIHITPQYSERAWIVVDGGPKGEELMKSLRNKFATWPADHFATFSKPCFEEYYPPQYAEQVARIVQIPNGLEKQTAKGELVQVVLSNALADITKAKLEFSKSADEVLQLLNYISEKLAGGS
jgi:hypothetical protein